MSESKRTEAREYLKGNGELERKLIAIAYGRRWGSKPILVPLHRVLKVIAETRKEFPLQQHDGYKEYIGKKIPSIAQEPFVWQKFLEEITDWFVEQFGVADEKKEVK